MLRVVDAFIASLLALCSAACCCPPLVLLCAVVVVVVLCEALLIAYAHNAVTCECTCRHYCFHLLLLLLLQDGGGERRYGCIMVCFCNVTLLFLVLMVAVVV